MTYPVTSPSRSARTHCSGEPPCRLLSGSFTGIRSQPGRRRGVPGRAAASRPYTASQASSACSGDDRRTRTPSVPGGSARRTREVSILRLISAVAAP